MAAKESSWDDVCLVWLFKDQVHRMLMIPPNMPKGFTNTLAVQIIHNWRKESKNVQETEIKQALFENRTRQTVLLKVHIF